MKWMEKKRQTDKKKSSSFSFLIFITDEHTLHYLNKTEIAVVVVVVLILIVYKNSDKIEWISYKYDSFVLLAIYLFLIQILTTTTKHKWNRMTMMNESKMKWNKTDAKIRFGWVNFFFFFFVNTGGYIIQWLILPFTIENNNKMQLPLDE